MTRLARKLLYALLAVMVALPLTSGPAHAAYSRAELDQMLAPIALYPDPLLSQILMASTYPAEVAEAARWSRANPGVEGDAAVRMVQDYEWDPSVKSLVAFPQLLARMDENPDWTRKLGDAFVVQEPVVMEAVQGLRRRAQEAGQLATDDRLRVIGQPGAIVIEPANPQYVYVPYYDPWIAYGPWWWSAYPPFYWAPWPGYVRAYRPGFWWGAPVGVSVGFFFGGVDWQRRYVRVARVDNYYVRPTWVNRQIAVTPGRWQRDYWQRRDSARRDFTRRDPVARPQNAAPAPLREQRREERREERRGLAAPRVQAAPQQFSAPRLEGAPRTEVRQGFQRAPERGRDFERAQRAPEPRRFEQRQATAPAAAPRLERREQRVERREQRVERREQRADRHEQSKGGHRALN